MPLTTGILTVSAPLVTSGQITIPTGAATISLTTASVTRSKSFHILAPANATTYNVWKVPFAVTMTRVNCLEKGGTSLTGALYEADANGINAAQITTPAAITAASQNTQSTITNSSIDADDYILWITTATSGAVESFTCSFDYTVN